MARVDDWTLHDSQLADLLVLAQPFPLEAGAVRDLVRHWIGVAALARRASAEDVLTGHDAVRESMWLERREALLSADREDRLGSSVREPGERDFRSGRYRLLAHVLRRVGQETSRAERDLQRRTAERILADLVAGGSWDDAVARSEDLSTRESSGLLGVLGPGELPPGLEEAASHLEAGQVSSVIESDQGFHILYRPSWTEVSGLFEVLLRERLLEEADAASAEGLLRRRGYAASSGAVASLRVLASDPAASMASDQPMAAWEGGSLSAGVVARYVAGLPAESRAEMHEAADSILAGFLEELAIRELRIHDARARGLDLDSGMEARLRQQHLEEVEQWRAALGAPGEAPVTREGLDRYMERMVSRRRAVRPLPPLFERWLLDRVDWTLVETGIPGAVAGARAMLAGADAASPVERGSRPAHPSGAPRVRDP